MGRVNVEQQFEIFMRKGLGCNYGKELDKHQILEMKKAFYGGIVTGSQMEFHEAILACREFLTKLSEGATYE